MWNQVLHCLSVIASRQPCFSVQSVSLVDLRHINLDSQSGFFGKTDRSLNDPEWFSGQTLAVLPYPVSVDGRDSAWSRRSNVGVHRQRHIEVTVGVRSPG